MPPLSCFPCQDRMSQMIRYSQTSTFYVHDPSIDQHETALYNARQPRWPRLPPSNFVLNVTLRFVIPSTVSILVQARGAPLSGLIIIH